MTNATNSASRRITAPQVLTFPAMRRLSERLLGPPESRRRTIAVAAGWRALTLLVLPPYVFALVLHNCPELISISSATGGA